MRSRESGADARGAARMILAFLLTCLLLIPQTYSAVLNLMMEDRR